MSEQHATPESVANEIRSALRQGGSAKHAESVQRFFTEPVRSHGWRTADVRRAALKSRKAILTKHGPEFLLKLADNLFTGEISEEKNFAIFLLEKRTDDLGLAEFKLFETWLARIRNWSDHDGLVHYLIAPMIADNPSWSKNVFRWAKSQNRWYRRAACVALIQGTRRKLFFPEIVRLSEALLSDEDDMVQKGLGWLLRETAKANPKPTTKYLMKIRGRAPRFVLRTACETLPRQTRSMILG